MERRQLCLHVWRSLLVALAHRGHRFRQIGFLSYVVYDYVRFVARIRKHHGDRTAFKVFKETEVRVKRLFLDASRPARKPRYAPFGMWVKTDVWGVPLPLYRLRKLAIRKTRWTKALAALIVGSYRSLIPVPWVPFPSSELVPRTKNFFVDRSLLDRGFRVLRDVWRVGKAKVRTTDLWLRDQWRSTSSPYSDSAVHGAPFDASVLLQSDEAFTAIIRLQRALSFRAGMTKDEVDSCESSYVSWLERLAGNSVQLRRYSSERPKRCLQRFTYVADRGGKMRGVTTVNYHLQSSLVPIQRSLMSLLRHIRTDATYDEELALERIRGWTASGRSCSSYDLPDATTQFPLEVSSYVVAHLLGKEVAAAWFDVVRLPAFFPGIGFRRYARGASMGLYSVWPIFAIAHHAIVQGAAASVGLSPFYLYAIRGDDVCLADSRLSAPYKRFWKGLGQEPSPAKSLEASTYGPGLATFAKRTLIRGRIVEALSFAEWRAAVLVEPLALVDLLPRLASLGGPSQGRFYPHSFVSILKSLRSDYSFIPVCDKMRAVRLRTPVAARYSCSAESAARRAMAVLEAWPLVGSVPPYWWRFEDDFTPKQLDQLQEMFRLVTLRSLARQAGESLAKAGIKPPEGIVALEAPEPSESYKLSPLLRGCRLSQYFDTSDLPTVKALHRVCDELSGLEVDTTRWDTVARISSILSQARGLSDFARGVLPRTRFMYDLRREIHPLLKLLSFQRMRSAVLSRTRSL